MRIGLIDVDGHNFPNLALMRISAWHKSQGDFDRRFEFEDKGFIDTTKPFKWAMLDSDLQLDMFLMEGKYYDHR